MSKKIAIVVQRYGNEVNGGAELHAKLLAEQLNSLYELEVLTTTALDYNLWENYYPKGLELINNVSVRRFPTILSTKRQLRKARRGIFSNKKYFKILRFFGLFDYFDQRLSLQTPTEKDVNDWLKKQGPYCPEMITYINQNKDYFDAFIFFTYLYYPTAVGMPIVKAKSIFIPTAHDEKIMFTKPYEQIFSQPAFIMYNTEAEKSLVNDNFENVTQQHDIAGVGIELNTAVGDLETILKKYKLDGPYFIYIGRIDSSKGCAELIRYFEKYCEMNKQIKLVLVGKNYMDARGTDRIILTGFIQEEEKNALLAACEGLIVPSKHESLSMVALEALAAGKTVIVNSDCKVLTDHIEKSKTGYCFQNYNDFSHKLDLTLKLTLKEKNNISILAKSYVKANYCWKTIIEKFKSAINRIHHERVIEH